MAMNRVQFQPGLSMAAFLERYGSKALCEAALVAARWPARRRSCPMGWGVSVPSPRSGPAMSAWSLAGARPAS